MKARGLSAALLAASVVAMTGCAGNAAVNPPGEGRGDITIWYSNNEQELQWGEQMVEAWNAENPDEQITGQEIPAGRSSEEVIGAAITAGNSPCLIYNTAPSAVGQFEKQQGLVNLSELEGGAAYIEERTGETSEQYQNADGDYFQMPWKSNPVVIFYNKDMFEEAGLDPDDPQLATYDEFLDTARTLVDAGVAPNAILPAPTSEFFQMQFDFYPLYAAETGGEQIVEDQRSTFDDEAGFGVADFWATLYSEGLAGQERYQGDAFADGVAAMAIVGPYAVSIYQDVNWGSVPVPTREGKDPEDVYTFSDAKNVGLYSACENQATAWDVLKFSTSLEQDRELLEITGQMPLRDQLQETYADYFEENPEYRAFGDQVSRTVDVPPGPNTVRILQAFRNAWSGAVIFGQGDPEQALDAAAVQIDDIATQP